MNRNEQDLIKEIIQLHGGHRPNISLEASGSEKGIRLCIFVRIFCNILGSGDMLRVCVSSV